MKSYWSFILLLVVIVFATSVHPSTRPNRIPSVTVPKETPIAVGTSSEYTTELSPERADIDFTAQLVSPIKDESAKKVVEDFVSVAATTDDINPLLSEPIASPTDDQPAIEISNFDIPALNDFIVIQELRGIAFLFITITMLLLAVIYHSQIQIHRFAYMLRRLRVPRVMPDATVTELPVIRNDADGSHIHNLLATILSLIPGYFKCIQLVSDGNSVYEVFAKSRQDKIRMLARYGHLRRRPHIGQHRTKDSYSDVKLTYRPVWAISPRASVREQRIRISKSRQNESFRNHILKPLTKVKDTIIEIDEAAVPVVVPIKRPIAVCQSPVVDSEQQQEWMQEVSHEHDSEVDNKSDDDHERSFDSKLDTPILTAIAEPQHAPRKKSVTDITTEGDAAKAAERRPQKSQLLTPPLKKRQLFAQAPGAFKIYEEPVHSQLPPGTGAPFQARALLNGPNRDIENLQTAGVVQEPVKRLQSLRTALANVNNNTVRTTTSALQLQPSNKSINVPTGIEPLRKHLVQTAAMELRLSKELTTFVQEDVPTSVAKSQIKNVDDSNVEHHIRHAIINRSLHEDMRKYDR